MKTCLIAVSKMVGIIAVLISMMSCSPAQKPIAGNSPNQTSEVELPQYIINDAVSVEQAIKQRRSVRSYDGSALTLTEVSQVLFSTQGITDEGRGLRAVPSAGATFPLEVYLVAGDVTGLAAGIYRYNPQNHSLRLLKKGDFRTSLMNASNFQVWVKTAPASVIISAVYSRTTNRYGERGKRYVYMEVGHAGQNIHLQCEALGLGSVMVGAFSDEAVKKLAAMPGQESPMYVIPFGRKKK